MLNAEKGSNGDKQRAHTYRLPARYAFCSVLLQNFAPLHNVCRLPETFVSLAWTAIQTRAICDVEFLEKTLACLPPNIGVRRVFAEAV